MRAIRGSDWLSRVVQKTYESRLLSLDFSGVTGLGTGRLSFSPGITAITGANGIGKSTLLEAISVLYGQTAGRCGSRLNPSTLQIDALSRGGQVTISKAPFGAPLSSGDLVRLRYVDPASDAARLIAVFSQSNLEELLEQHEFQERLDLKAVNAIVGKAYTSLLVAEIDDFDDDEIVPYFMAECDGTRYGSEGMGRGELAANLLLWRLQQCGKGDVLIVDEPESHLSLRAQRALVHEIAKATTRLDLTLIFATHSAVILDSLPQEHHRLVYKDQSGARIMEGPSPGQVRALLGLPDPPVLTPPKIKYLALVEDESASVFLEELIGAFEADLIENVEIAPAGDHGKIAKHVEKFPRVKVVRLAGVIDGDQSGKYNDPLISFLPGTKSPDTIALEFLRANVMVPAQDLSLSEDSVNAALCSVVGVDPHDCFAELSRALSVEKNRLLGACLRGWISANDNEARKSWADIRRTFGFTESS